jgi:2-keto-4-pentenoate hydratase/2-oxohepta-3-ene-1,7-dioic acid hydratase in catechol pathway
MVQWSHDKMMLSERRAVSKPSRNKNVQDLSLYLDVNGERLQNSTTRNMIFTVPHIVWYCSQFFILEPGDLITTGTPPGVGLGMKPLSHSSIVTSNNNATPSCPNRCR